MSRGRLTPSVQRNSIESCRRRRQLRDTLAADPVCGRPACPTKPWPPASTKATSSATRNRRSPDWMNFRPGSEGGPPMSSAEMVNPGDPRAAGHTLADRRLRPIGQGARPFRRRAIGCLLVASDRLSAFDVVLPTPIPDKAALLTGVSRFLVRPDHRHHPEPSARPGPGCSAGRLHRRRGRRDCKGRMMLCRVQRCCGRGHRPRLRRRLGLEGLPPTGAICGIELPAGLRESIGAGADLHALHQGRSRARREHRLRRDGRARRRSDGRNGSETSPCGSTARSAVAEKAGICSPTQVRNLAPPSTRAKLNLD